MSETQITLDDKYRATSGRVFMNGTQALVRLPLVQIRRDRAAGHNTGGFISGYRGSPLGGYDTALMGARALLDEAGVVFQPGVNEDLAATAIWGTQQLSLSPGARRDGVFGIWYGKGPGVDRSGDVFKHANAAGTSPLGGVLCIAGDDHAAKSSSIPHQSDHAFMSAVIPMLYPASIQEFVEYGLMGIAMSRYSGCWVGMKVISDTIETTAIVDLAGENRVFVTPDFPLPPGGVHLRWPDERRAQDSRLQTVKAYAAIAFSRANRIDRIVLGGGRARLGVMASGKAYADLAQALTELGIDAAMAERIGVRVYKVGMPWPLEPEGAREFADGLEEIVVFEERREILENQVKVALYHVPSTTRPRVLGKFDHHGAPLLPLDENLSVEAVVVCLADRIAAMDLPAALHAELAGRAAFFRERVARQKAPLLLARQPHYCSGCPHNTSTVVPDGSRALAGIGCHFMVQWMDRNTETFSQMGGEGVTWVGVAPFTDEKHIFTNLGDGTYFHSGLLAIRQSVAGHANITYKILFNGAVAMTGGQAFDGELSIPQMSHQLFHEGVKPIYLLSDDPSRHDPALLAPGVVVDHRDALDRVSKILRESPGCSAIIYDQACATELRRKRSRGLAPAAPQRVAINERVCEGCGDCSVQSNCLSIEPVETEFGRKRAINQSTCNQDLSCVKGFCPSFVTVTGATIKRSEAAIELSGLPDPVCTIDLGQSFGIAVAGIGGTGILTIGGVIGMAAHLENKAVLILDMAGLAQKGGAVLSHIQLADAAEKLSSPHIVSGCADLVLAADMVVAASEAIDLCEPARTRGVLNTKQVPVAQFTRDRNLDFQQGAIRRQLQKALRPDAELHDFAALAEKFLGDTVFTNMMMVGYALQRGFLPLGLPAIERAIELNGVAVDRNKRAVALGRTLAADPARLAVGSGPDRVVPVGLPALVEHRRAHLTAYQNAALADRFAALVERVRAAEARVATGTALAEAAARSYAKLLAYKDEYEVARLYTDGRFEAALARQFAGTPRVSLSMAPPLISRIDPNTGRPKKREFGPWIMPVLRVMARLKGVRGTAFDPFGYTEDRRVERELIVWFEALVDTVLAGLAERNHAQAVALLSLPDSIRGFGPIKHEAIESARAEARARLADFARAPVRVAA